MPLMLLVWKRSAKEKYNKQVIRLGTRPLPTVPITSRKELEMKDLKGIYDSSEIQEQDKPGRRHDDQQDDKTGDPEESLLKSRDHSKNREIYDSSEIHEPEKPEHDRGLDRTEDQEDIVKSRDRDYPKDRSIYDTSEIHEPEKPEHDRGLDKTEDQEDVVKSQDRDYPKDRGIYDTSEIHEPEKPDRRKILEPEEEDN